MKRRPRSLEEIALENATRGCVGKTYAALVAGWCAAQVRDARIRERLTQISEAELLLAEEAWRIAAWVEPRLSDEQRRRVDTIRRETAARVLAMSASDGKEV